ncbi:MAG: hypothetical protein MZV64_02105 [Ignavibacteriales bacterium]|nr:hypothetical protein [Ignavibacteriales bacterium]
MGCHLHQQQHLQEMQQLSVQCKADLIVIEVAKKYDVEIGFWQVFKVGFLITVITLHCYLS